MDHGLPVVPVVTGVLLVYAGYFAYAVVQHVVRSAALRPSHE